MLTGNAGGLGRGGRDPFGFWASIFSGCHCSVCVEVELLAEPEGLLQLLSPLPHLIPAPGIFVPPKPLHLACGSALRSKVALFPSSSQTSPNVSELM